MIGRFRSDLTEILETFPPVFCFPKSRINENSGKTTNPSKIDAMCAQDIRKLNFMLEWYYDENRIFPIEAVLKHKQVLCMRRKMPF